MTDSEQVPWGKGEKNAWMASEIVSETMRLQAVGGQYVYLFRWRPDGVPFV